MTGEGKKQNDEISTQIQPISFKDSKLEQPILPKAKVEVPKNQSEAPKLKETKDIDQKCQLGISKSVNPSQRNIVLKEDKSIENLRKSIEQSKKQEEEARVKTKEMQQMLEVFQKDK